jgi:hypothetical protein
VIARAAGGVDASGVGGSAQGKKVDEDLAALLDAEADELLGELDDAESEQPPVTCIGMFSSGRGDLSASEP